MIKRQCEIDVFFIDWEKQQDFVDIEDRKRGISIWRTLFIANEFNELSITRIVSIEWTLMLIGFFMSGLEWDNYQAETPLLTTEVDKIQKNFILKYFLVTFLWVLIAGVQIVYKKIDFLYIRGIQNYMDLCSVANISVFLLDQDVHGFYIHGKNPSLIAEGNSQWISENLEKQGQRKDPRGPEAGQRPVNDQNDSTKAIEQNQIFEILIPNEMRLNYEEQYLAKKQQDALIANRDKEEIERKKQKKQVSQQQLQAEKDDVELLKEEHEQRDAEIEKLKLNDPKAPILSDVEETKRRLTQYLQLVITEVIINKNDRIAEKGPFHRWFGYPARLLNAKNINDHIPLFFRDAAESKEYSIEGLFFAGQELKLICFDIYVYNFFDIATGSTLIAIVLTYIIDKFFAKLREDMGQNNISEKTLISDKFLI